MIILHEYVSGFREEDQLETWSCLVPIRKKYKVIDCDLANTDEYAYDDFIKRWWGVDDFINIEMDNVVSLEQVESLVNCPQPYCNYLYGCNYVFGENVPTDALGVVKIAKSIQDKVPCSTWYRKGIWKTLDARIKNNIVQALPPDRVALAMLRVMVFKIKGVPFAHNHNDVSHLLKHNHDGRVGEPDPYTGVVETPGHATKEPEFAIGDGKAFEITVRGREGG
jgi:hypothetical protein